jgi:GGDEF domain-containing protein
MLADATENQVQEILERFTLAVHNENDTNEKPYEIAYSAGIATFEPEKALSIEDMIQQADAAMYKDKGTSSR